MKRENAITIATTDSQAFLCFLAASRPVHATRMQHADITQIMFCSGARIGLAPPEWRLPESGQTGIACAAQLEAGDFMAWRTQREQDASPNGGTMSMSSNDARTPVSLHKPRAALRLDRQRLAEDLLVPLRRQWKRS
jgi:hypothetical protein